MKTLDTSHWSIERTLPVCVLVLAIPLVAALQAASDHVPAPATPHAWTVPIERADTFALAGETDRAILSLRDAHGAAFGSRRWESMVEVGDAWLRLHGPDTRRTVEPKAREAYLVALFRARQEQSAAGVLRVADAFENLGDQALAAQCRRIAAGLGQ